MAKMPVAQRFATYPGRHTHLIGQVMGPNLLQEMLTVVEVTYDPVTDSTRAGFAYGIYKLLDDPEDS